MDKWTWRDRVASWFHRIGYRIAPGEARDVLLRDADGVEIFSISVDGGFVASGPREPYTAHTRTYTDDDDLTGTITDW